MIHQPTLILSPYIEIYNLVVPKDNLLRKINELVDFSFVYENLSITIVEIMVGVRLILFVCLNTFYEKQFSVFQT